MTSDSPSKDRTRERGAQRPASDGNRRTMGDISHTHPHTDRGAINRPFERGPTVAADGGRRDAVSDEEETMEDVSHTPPAGAGSADGVFDRGNERDEER